MASADPLPQRPKDCPGIDTGMAVKAPVLISEQHLDKSRIDLAGLDRQTPTSIFRRERAEEPVMAVDDDRGYFRRIAERWWSEI
ncbi:hypothetical protein MnTg02_02248 [bacterium MnTg02]|nr:hypothetical protein MnTg02_02248 [bacterium MnTg02]